MLRRAFDVWFVFQKLLNSQQDLLHCDVWLPVFFIIQDREAYCARWVNVWVWKYRLEHAFGRPDWEVVGEVHRQIVLSSLPGGVFGARDDTIPFEEVSSAVWVVAGLGYETKRVVGAPVFSFFFETVDDELVDFFFHR